MAARLKTVLDRHRRVVFTCGLAHWEALQNRLRDTELAPAPVEPNPSSPQADFRRAVVHPTMALYHCDVFPAVVDRYEMHRLAEPTSNTALRENRVNVSKLFLDILQHGYRLNAAKHVNANQLDRLAEDWEARMDFERLTANLSMLSNQQVPDIMTVLSAADGCLSEPFRRTIGEAFMEADWVTREEFPDLDVLLPAERRRGKCVAAQLATRTGSAARSSISTHYPVAAMVAIRWKCPSRTAGKFAKPRTG